MPTYTSRTMAAYARGLALTSVEGGGQHFWGLGICSFTHFARAYLHHDLTNMQTTRGLARDATGRSQDGCWIFCQEVHFEMHQPLITPVAASNEFAIHRLKMREHEVKNADGAGQAAERGGGGGKAA